MKKERKKGRGDRQRYGEEEMRREKRERKKLRGEERERYNLFFYFLSFELQ